MDLLRGDRHKTFQLIQHLHRIHGRELSSEVLDLARELPLYLKAVEDGVAQRVDGDEQRGVAEVEDALRDPPRYRRLVEPVAAWPFLADQHADRHLAIVTRGDVPELGMIGLCRGGAQSGIIGCHATMPPWRAATRA